LNIINIYSIGKNEKDDYASIEQQFIKTSSKYSKITHIDIINRDIIKKQSRGITSEIKESYSEAFKKYIQTGNEFNIILDPLGKEFTTDKFANILLENSKINFFIGGAYGFSRDFLKKGDVVLSLSKLTMSHKIARVVLFEQIYRALTINANHPYHK